VSFGYGVAQPPELVGLADGHPAWGNTLSIETHLAIVQADFRMSQLALAEAMLGSAFDGAAPFGYRLRIGQPSGSPFMTLQPAVPQLFAVVSIAGNPSAPRPSPRDCR